MSEQIKIFKYKPFKKTVTILSPDGSKREEKQILVKDAYIMIKSNGDSIVGDEKLMRRLGFSVAGVSVEYNSNSTLSKVVTKSEKVDEDDDEIETKPSKTDAKIPEGLTKIQPNKQ